MPTVDDIRDGIAGMSSPQRAAATWMAGAWDEYAYRLSCAMAAVGPPPGIVGTRNVLQALHGAERTQEHPADAARQRFAHARRVLETIKHSVDSASAALALAEGQLTTAIPPSSSSALVAVNPGAWSPTQDQRVGDVPVDALIASRPASRHGCVRHHPFHPSQDASHHEAAPLGLVEHQSTVSDIQDHVTIDECSLVRPAHIRKDGAAHHHAHHSPGPPSPTLLATSDKDRRSPRSPSASQDGRPYDAEGQAQDEHVISRNNAQTHYFNGTSACGAYDTSACDPPDLDPEAVRLALQQELRQQVWEAKKRALEAEAARVRAARSGSVGSSEGTSAEVDAVLPPSLTRRSTSSARRHSSPAPPRRLVDRIEAPRLVDRIAPRRASLVDRIEPLPSVDPPFQSPPHETQSTSLIDRIERTPCASPWRSPTPSLDESCSPSVDESEDSAADDLEDPAAGGLEDLALDQCDKNRNLTPTVRSPSPLVLSPTPRASSGVAYDSFDAVYDGSSSWSEVDTIIHEAVNKSPSTNAQRTPDHVHRTSDHVHQTLDDAHRTRYNDAHRTRYNADQAGWTPASPATSVDSAITRGVEEMVVDEEEMQVDNEETDSEMVIHGRDGDDSQINDTEGVRADDGYDGEMPMEFSEDEGEGDDGTQSGRGTQHGRDTQRELFQDSNTKLTAPVDASAAPEEPPTTPTEPGSPALATLPFFEDVPIDGPSPPSSPAPSLGENRALSPYASRVQGLLESTSRAVSQTISKGQAVYGSQDGDGEMDRSPESRSPSAAPSITPEGCDEAAVFAPANASTSGEYTSSGLDVCANRDRIPRLPPLRFGRPYYSTDMYAETPATLRYSGLLSHSAYSPLQSTYPPSQSAHPASVGPSAHSKVEPAVPPRARKGKAPAHSRLYKKARRSLANSMSSATARDIKTIAHRPSAMNCAARSPAMFPTIRPPVTSSTVGASLVAASAPPPGQVVTFAQLGAGYRLSSGVLEAADTESASESPVDQDSSDSDLDSLFDEIPEDEFDEESSHSSENHDTVKRVGKGADEGEKGEGVSGGNRVIDSDTEYTVEEEVVAVRTRLGEGEITFRRRVRKASGDRVAARPSKRIKLTY